MVRSPAPITEQLVHHVRRRDVVFHERGALYGVRGRQVVGLWRERVRLVRLGQALGRPGLELRELRWRHLCYRRLAQLHGVRRRHVLECWRGVVRGVWERHLFRGGEQRVHQV